MKEIYRVTAEDITFNALIYADPGVGKTTLAASCQDHPKMKNVLFLNIEGGLLSVAHRDDIHAVDVRSTAELEAFFWRLANGDSDLRSVRTVIIDSGTELQTVNLEGIVNAAIKGGKNQIKGAKRTSDDVFMEDYGKSTNELKRLFRWFKDLPINVIITALAKEVYPKVPPGTDLTDIEPLAVLPSFTNKLCKSVMGIVDFVWYMGYDPEEERRFLLTRDQGPYRAKTRGARFAEAIGSSITLGPDMMMPEIYDLLIRAETGKLKTKKGGK